MASGRLLLRGAFAGLDGLLNAGGEGFAELLIFFHALRVVAAIIAIVAPAMVIAFVMIVAPPVMVAVAIAVMSASVVVAVAVPIMSLTTGLGGLFHALGPFLTGLLIFLLALGCLGAAFVVITLAMFTIALGLGLFAAGLELLAVLLVTLLAFGLVFLVTLGGLGAALVAVVIIATATVVVIDHEGLAVEAGVGAFLAGRALGAAFATAGALRALLLELSQFLALFLGEDGGEFLLAFLAQLGELGTDFLALDVAIAGGGEKLLHRFTLAFRDFLVLGGLLLIQAEGLDEGFGAVTATGPSLAAVAVFSALAGLGAGSLARAVFIICVDAQHGHAGNQQRTCGCVQFHNNFRQRMGFSQLPLRTRADCKGYMHFCTFFLKNGH